MKSTPDPVPGESLVREESGTVREEAGPSGEETKAVQEEALEQASVSLEEPPEEADRPREETAAVREEAGAPKAGGEAAVDATGGGDPFADDPFAVEEEHPRTISDPIEPVNRAFFWINDKLYFYLLKPVARGYRFVVPETVRSGVSNFFSNLATPIRMANSILQLKFEDATKEGFRFAINTTVGLLGVMDVARDQGGLPEKKEDFGQTLGSYGIGHGFYLFLPLIGPTSLRDGGGMATDFLFDPFSYADLTWPETAGIRSFQAENELSLDKETYETIVKQSVDPYLTVRNGYLQRRRSMVDK